MKRRIFKLKKLINKPIFVTSVKIAVVILATTLLTLFLYYLKKNNPPNIKVSKNGDYSYIAKNGLYTASFGEKNTNVAKVSFAIGDNEISFTPASGQVKEHKVVKEKESIKFEDVYKDIDFVYYTKPSGIKEDIILKNPVEYKVLPFYLDFKGVEPQYVSDNIKGKVFYDKDNNYLFHIEKPFAIDSNNVRSDNFDYQIRKDSETGKYVALLSFDTEWINSKDRKFPITVDPTIVHDTTAEFATGTLNHVKDTGSGSTPTLETYYQELPADQYTVGLWHMNEGSANTCTGGTNDVCDKSGNVNDAAFNGNATFSSTALLGSHSATYDGTGDYSITGNYNQAASAAFTVEGWVYLAANSTNNNGFFGHTQSGDQGWVIETGVSGSTNMPGFYTQTGGYLRSTQALTLNKWHHLAGTFDNGVKILYIDGIEVGRATGAAYSALNIPFTFGRFYYNTDNFYLNGNIDEVRFSNIARSPEEIKKSASRRPYATYTSDVIDLTAVVSWNPLTWTEAGVNTGDGETLKDSNSLIAQWNFNGTSGTSATNDAGSCSTSCNGTLTNFASTASQDAAAGTGWTSANRRWGAGALMFDGSNDYVDVTTASSIKGLTQYTVETWFNVKSMPAAGSAQTIYKEHRNSDASVRSKILIENASATYANVANSLTFRFRDTDASTAINVNTGANTIQAGTWYHAVIVYDSVADTQNIYLNGKLIKSATNTTVAVSNTAPFAGVRFGVDDTVEYFNGILDSTRIYSRAFDAREIMSNYQAGNIELQTRVGADTSPDDGSWSAWSPTSGETAIDSYDGPYQYNTSDSGLVSYWPMDETSNDTCAGGSNDACDKKTSYDAADSGGSVIVDGKYGKARYFDGSNDVLNIPDTAGLKNQDFTISAWINPSSVTGNHDIVVQDKTTQYANLYTNGSNLKFYSVSLSPAATTAGGTISTYTWTHVAVTKNGTTVKLYVNGAEVSSTTMTGTIAYNSSGWSISNDLVEQFNGSIDEVRMYSSALSATTIQQQYLEGTTRPQSLHPLLDSTYKIESSASQKIETGRPLIDGNTVGLWHLDETSGSGAYLNDSTSNGNDGTPTGTSLVQGVSNKARSFNGSSDYITAPDSTSLRPAHVTVEAWVKSTSTNTKAMVDKSLGSLSGSSYILSTGLGAAGTGCTATTNIAHFAVIGGGVWACAEGTTAINDGKWHYIVGTYDQSNLRLYVDGTLQRTTAFTNAIDYNTNNFSIGKYLSEGAGTTTPWNGQIDEVRVSSTARSAEEIAESYRSGRDHYINKTISSTDLSGKSSLPFYVAADRPGQYLTATIGESAFANYQSDSNTLGLWHLSEQSGSGSYIKDDSGNNNNLSLGGSPGFGQGKIGKARIFSSTNYLACTDANCGGTSKLDPNSSTGISYGAWIYPTANQTGYVIAKYGATGQGYALRWVSGNTINAFFGNSACNNNSSGLTSGTLALNNWYHVVITVSAANPGVMSMYINGALIGQTGSTEYYCDNTGDFRIGTESGGTTAPFAGTIDEVRVDKSVRTATEIRQAYEVSARTHSITIDFGAKLDSGNLIADVNDLGFTVDATYYGLNQKGDSLYKGDKIIIRENVNGVEYLAQGTVDSITSSTGAATVSAWDGGSTFPSGGYTANASVFKWQREYWNINNEALDSHIDAVTNLTLRLTDGNEGRTIWLDDLKSNSSYLTDPSGSTITSSTGNRYIQYRAVLSSFDESVTATMSGVTIDYVSNLAPSTPSLDLPTDTTTGQSLSPVFKTTSTDSDSDYLRYKIELCTNVGMTTGCQTFDQTSSQTGWSGQNAQTSTAYTSGTQATYTVQTPLTAGTTYYWRSYAIDPAGTNTFSSTQTPYSFTTNFIPSTPSLDLPANAATGEPITTIFKTTSTDGDSDYLRYKIQVCTNLIMTTGCQTFDQTSSQTGWSGQNAQTSTAYTSGTQGVYTVVSNLSFGTTYYWRSYAIDPAGTNTFSSTQTPYSFTTVTNSSPQAPTGLLIEGETNPIMVTDLTPEFSAICNESDVIDTLTKYRIQVDTSTSFASPVWDSGAAGTAMTACNPGSRSVDISYAGSALSLNGNTYHWRIKFWDNNGAEGSWSNDNPFFKMDNPNDGRPSNCRVTETPNDTSLTLKWDDNSSSETQFRIEKNVNGGGFVFLTNKAPNSTSNIDNSVSESNTYQYRIRSEGSSNSNWCETSVFNLLEGNFLLKGLNLKGLNFR